MKSRLITISKATICLMLLTMTFSSCTTWKKTGKYPQFALLGTWQKIDGAKEMIQFESDEKVIHTSATNEKSNYKFDYLGYTRTDVIFFLNEYRSDTIFQSQKHYARFKNANKMTLKYLGEGSIHISGEFQRVQNK